MLVAYMYDYYGFYKVEILPPDKAYPDMPRARILCALTDSQEEDPDDFRVGETVHPTKLYNTISEMVENVREISRAKKEELKARISDIPALLAFPLKYPFFDTDDGYRADREVIQAYKEKCKELLEVSL